MNFICPRDTFIYERCQLYNLNLAWLFVSLECLLFRNYKFLLAFWSTRFNELIDANCSHYILQQVLRKNMANIFISKYLCYMFSLFFQTFTIWFSRKSPFFWTFFYMKTKKKSFLIFFYKYVFGHIFLYQ